jgi:hypothetical protein
MTPLLIVGHGTAALPGGPGIRIPKSEGLSRLILGANVAQIMSIELAAVSGISPGRLRHVWKITI